MKKFKYLLLVLSLHGTAFTMDNDRLLSQIDSLLSSVFPASAGDSTASALHSLSAVAAFNAHSATQGPVLPLLPPSAGLNFAHVAVHPDASKKINVIIKDAIRLIHILFN